MQAINSPYLLNGNRRRPRYVTVYGPYLLDNSRELCRVEPDETACKGVTEYDEGDVPYRERDTIEYRPFVKLLSDGVRDVDRRGNSGNGFFTRCYHQLAPRVIAKNCSMPQPNKITWEWLLDRVKGMIFRTWYNAVIWVKVLEYESGLNGPRRK